MTLPPLGEAYFTYILSDAPFPGLEKHVPFHGHTISYSTNTDFYIARRGGRALCCLGFCVDSHGEIPAPSVPEWLLESAETADDLLRLSARLAGRYALLYEQDGAAYALTDACAMMSAYYAVDRLCVSSSEKLIADHLGLTPSNRSRKIRHSGANVTNAMPGDLSMFDEIRFLLPNHYLTLPDHSARFFPNREKIEPLSPKSAAEKLMPLLKNVAAECARRFSLRIPLTAGIDSRLVFGIVRSAAPDIETFTYKRDTPADYEVPAMMAEAMGFRHKLVEEPKTQSAYAEALRNRAGEWTARQTIFSAYEFQQNFPGCAYIGGAIIEQIGRYNTAGGLSKALGWPSLVACMLRNFSAGGYFSAFKWAKDAKKKSGGVSLFDLYGWESRCGRWVTQTAGVHALAGIPYLNLFNCREMIELMLRVPEHERFKQLLVFALYDMVDRKLLSFPVNPHKTTSYRIKHTALYHFFALYAGQLLGMAKRWVKTNFLTD